MGTTYLQDINDVDAGWTHSLALDVNSFVWAWGNNYNGQLGDGSENTIRSTPIQVHGVDDEGYLTYIAIISAGRSGLHSLAVDANGYAYGWGYNKYGQCGNGVSEANELTPVYVDQGQQPDDPNDANDWLKHLIDISAGSNNSIALEADLSADPNSAFQGCVYTWGCNMWGEEPLDTMITPGWGLLGNGSDVNFADTPVKVLRGEQDVNEPNQVYLEHIVGISAGWDHLMALEKDDPNNPHLNGRVYTWGNNGDGWDSGGGRLGDGSTDCSDTPVVVLSGEQYEDGPCHLCLEHIVAVSAGEGHSMALEKNDPCDPNLNGRVYTWGDNKYGQLGNGCTDPCAVPVRVIRADGKGYLENIVSISAGSRGARGRRC